MTKHSYCHTCRCADCVAFERVLTTRIRAESKKPKQNKKPVSGVGRVFVHVEGLYHAF